MVSVVPNLLCIDGEILNVVVVFADDLELPRFS